MPPLTATFAAAGTAAAVELTLVQPLDVVKTRLHLESAAAPRSDAFGGSTVRALRGIYAVEGVRGLWRGFGTGLAIVIPRRGLKFAANSAFGSALERAAVPPRRRKLLAGALAGACEACVITPLEVLKIAMQTERTRRDAATTRLVAVARAINASGGVGAWYSGLGTTVAKHSIHSCVYFASHAELMALSRAPSKAATEAERVRWSAAAGFVAGVLAGVCNNPFDVLKSRQQVAAAGGLRGHELGGDYARVSTSAIALVRQDGVRILWRGLGAKLLRLGPGSAIIFGVYEAVLGRIAPAERKERSRVQK